jgi:hypothetical protein
MSPDGSERPKSISVSHVRDWGQSGLVVLNLSFVAVDPKVNLLTCRTIASVLALSPRAHGRHIQGLVGPPGHIR